MDITCIADLHGHYPELKGGDLLIVAGDLTARDTIFDHADFQGWLNLQPYNKKIFISGNHDNNSDKNFHWDDSIEYLCDSGTEFEGLKIWGTPWTLTFPGINPHCTAFTGTEEELSAKFAMIPEDTDILISHGPAYGILDKVKINGLYKISEPPQQVYEHCGSKSLYAWLNYVGRPLIHVFGHIHENYGISEVFATRNDKRMQSINCSQMNEDYDAVNKPIRIIL